MEALRSVSSCRWQSVTRIEEGNEFWKEIVIQGMRGGRRLNALLVDSLSEVEQGLSRVLKEKEGRKGGVKANRRKGKV